MLELTVLQQLSIWVIPVLLAVTLHEAAHAWTASHYGDNTAKLLGRVSINPIHHIDIVGTIIVPIAVLVLSNFSFVFGWAKPVPIRASSLKNPRRDMALVTAAGPVSNLIMAFLWAILLKIGFMLDPSSSYTDLFLVLTARAGIVINLLLAFLNLIPIPPLDGSKIVMSLLPPKQVAYYEKIEPYGFYILLLLMFTGILNWLVSAPINAIFSLLMSLFNL